MAHTSGLSVFEPTRPAVGALSACNEIDAHRATLHDVVKSAIVTIAVSFFEVETYSAVSVSTFASTFAVIIVAASFTAFTTFTTFTTFATLL